MRNTSVERACERLDAAAHILQNRLARDVDHLARRADDPAETRLALEIVVLKWVIGLLTRDVCRPVLEYARFNPLANECVDDEQSPRLATEDV